MVSQTPEADFSIVYQGDCTLVSLPMRLSVAEAVSFKTTCQQIIESGQITPTLVLDFEKTNFIDSSGIGALVTILKRTKDKNIDLILRNVGYQVMGIFKLTNLDGVLPIEVSTRVNESKDKHHHDRELPLTHPSVRSWVKRLMDIVGALVGLSITGVLFIPISIAIKIDSPGPLFFGQTRCGWMGRRFKIWKFRSMCINAEALKGQIQNQAQGAIFKNDNDPRITKVGKFLRRTSLDELPQFWNVLQGEMSLVGTRPPTPDEVEKYEVPQWQRLDVKPGMTGEWQVNGRSQVRDFEDVIRLDLRYQENWSLMYDIKLILKTIMVLFQKNSGAM